MLIPETSHKSIKWCVSFRLCDLNLISVAQSGRIQEPTSYERFIKRNFQTYVLSGFSNWLAALSGSSEFVKSNAYILKYLYLHNLKQKYYFVLSPPPSCHNNKVLLRFTLWAFTLWAFTLWEFILHLLEKEQKFNNIVAS